MYWLTCCTVNWETVRPRKMRVSVVSADAKSWRDKAPLAEALWWWYMCLSGAKAGCYRATKRLRAEFGLNERDSYSYWKTCLSDGGFGRLCKWEMLSESYSSLTHSIGILKVFWMFEETREKQKAERKLTSSLAQTHAHVDFFLLSLRGIDLFLHFKSGTLCFISLFWCTVFF